MSFFNDPSKIDPNGNYSISKLTDFIRRGQDGHSVREAIAMGIDTAYNDASEKHDNANMEVKLARGTNPNLNTRLNKMDETDRQNAGKIDSNHQEVTAQLAQTEQGLSKRVDNLVIPISPENANLEVTDAHVSVTKNRQFETIGQRFEDGEKDIESIHDDISIRLSNTLTNADFSNGRAGWGNEDPYTYKTDGDVLSISNNSATQVVYQSTETPIGSRVYQKASVRTLEPDCTSIRIREYPSARVLVEINEPEQDKWYDLSALHSFEGTRAVYVLFSYPSTGSKTSQIKHPMFIDLTKDFGAGNEPNESELLEVLGSSDIFFTGTKSFPSISAELKKSKNEIEKLATRMEDIPTNSTQGKKIILPNKTENITLFNGTNNAENWRFEPIGDSNASITNVSEIDKSQFPIGSHIAESTLHPWKFESSSIWESIGSSVTKLKISEGNEGLFHIPLAEGVTVGADEDIMVMIFADKISGGTAKFELKYFDKYPTLTTYRRTDYGKIMEGGDIWQTMNLPYTLGGTAYPRFTGNAPSYANINGFGIEVTEVVGDISIYVGGIFKVKNPLDKGILVIDFDDGFRSNYDFFEYMKGKYGYNASVGIVGSWIETEEERYLDKWQMIEMENNGWDMISHTWDHVPATHRGLKENFDSIKKNYDWLGEHGCHRGRRFFCHPTNQTTTDSIYATSLFHDLVRGTRTLTGQYPDTINQFEFPSEGWGGDWTESRWRGLLQTTQDLKVVKHVHAHGIESENSWNPFPDDLVQFKQFIDIIGEYDIEVMSYSELWDDVINRTQ